MGWIFILFVRLCVQVGGMGDCPGVLAPPPPAPFHPVQCRRQCRFCVHCCGLVALWAPESPGTRIRGVSGTCLCIVCLVLSPLPTFEHFPLADPDPPISYSLLLSSVV